MFDFFHLEGHMTSNSRGQRLLHGWRQFRINSGWIIGMTLLGIFVSVPAQAAAVFTVNNPLDVMDTNPGDGVCLAASGGCTLRAAIQETNALAGADTIILPSLPSPNAYFLLIVDELIITDSLTIVGGGASTSIIEGNKSVRPVSGVLHIFTGTVNISGVAIRNGARTFFGGGIVNIGTLTLINCCKSNGYFVVAGVVSSYAEESKEEAG